MLYDDFVYDKFDTYPDTTNEFEYPKRKYHQPHVVPDSVTIDYTSLYNRRHPKLSNKILEVFESYGIDVIKELGAFPKH